MALIDVPGLDEGVRFYGQAFGFVESARPMQGYAVIECDGLEIGLLEKFAAMSDTGRPCISTSM